MFTWNNGKEGVEFTIERLDRVLAYHAWHDLFPNAVSSVDLAIFFDHLSLTISPNGSTCGLRRGRGFRYEANWGKNLECKDVIEKKWRVEVKEQGTWNSIKEKLNESRAGLLQWQRVNGRNVGQKIKQVSELLTAEQSHSEGANVDFLHKLHSDLIKLQVEDDLYWRQRAKVEWMRFGDRNTIFFHASANQKKKKD